MKIACAHCGKTSNKPSGAVNRARAAGLRLFCDRRCFGLDRRKHKTKAQLVEKKRLYDVEYRRKNLEMLKAKKAEYFKRTYDPETARIIRKKRAPQHAEYCRRPKYKCWKAGYDRQYRAAKFGEFAEVYMLTIDLNREIKERATNHEIKWQNQTCNKAQFRHRAEKAEDRGRPRNRDRRDRHQAAVG